MTAKDDRRRSTLDWLVAHPAAEVRPWHDPVIQQCGFDARHSYVEQFWLPILGPSAVLALRRLADWLDRHPAGVQIDLVEFGSSLGDRHRHRPSHPDQPDPRPPHRLRHGPHHRRPRGGPHDGAAGAATAASPAAPVVAGRAHRSRTELSRQRLNVGGGAARGGRPAPPPPPPRRGPPRPFRGGGRRGGHPPPPPTNHSAFPAVVTPDHH